MNRQSDMERILKRIAMITGFVVLVISIYFSYDGFDQSVTGGNSGYTTLAVVIGAVLSIVVCVVQFIFSTSYKDLNWTLRIVGVATYVYSIYTNKLGASHTLGATDFMSWAIALFMDIYPEPAIAWALGEALTGDLFGNIGKMLFGTKTNRGNNVRYAAEQQEQTFVSLGDQHRSRKEQRKQGVISPIFSQKYTDKFKKR